MHLEQTPKSVKVVLHFVPFLNHCLVSLLKVVSFGTVLKAVCERESMHSQMQMDIMTNANIDNTK